MKKLGSMVHGSQELAMSFYIWGHANGILTVDLEVVWIGSMALSGNVYDG